MKWTAEIYDKAVNYTISLLIKLVIELNDYSAMYIKSTMWWSTYTVGKVFGLGKCGNGALHFIFSFKTIEILVLSFE